MGSYNPLWSLPPEDRPQWLGNEDKAITEYEEYPEEEDDEDGEEYPRKHRKTQR